MFLFIFYSHCTACRTLVPPTRDRTWARSPNHWTPREVPSSRVLNRGNRHVRFAQGLLFSLTKGPFHLYSGHTPRTLHPATATHTEPAAKNQAEAVRPLGVWEDHSGGISQVWAAEELFPKTPAPALLHQLYPVPTLAPGLQASRYVCTPPALVSPLGASKVKAWEEGWLCFEHLARG